MKNRTIHFHISSSLKNFFFKFRFFLRANKLCKHIWYSHNIPFWKTMKSLIWAFIVSSKLEGALIWGKIKYEDDIYHSFLSCTKKDHVPFHPPSSNYYYYYCYNLLFKIWKPSRPPRPLRRWSLKHLQIFLKVRVEWTITLTLKFKSKINT